MIGADPISARRSFWVGADYSYKAFQDGNEDNFGEFSYMVAPMFEDDSSCLRSDLSSLYFEVTSNCASNNRRFED